MMDNPINTKTDDKKQELTATELKETEGILDLSVIKEIKNKITEGYQSIHSEDKVILVIGNTGSGKSTLVNYLAGAKLIAEKKGFGKLLITVPEPVSSEMRVSHKLKSETAIPNSWKDNTTGVVYWDCPGFDDNRGPVQDIANAFYIKRLFELSKQVKIIIVTTESSFTEGRGVEFTNLIGSLANLFVDVEHFKESLSLIVTKATEDSEVSDVTGAIQEILATEETAFAKDGNQKKVLQYLAEHENQIGLFYAPKRSGEITEENRLKLLPVVEKTKPANNFAINVSVSDKSKLYVNDLISEINDQIYDDILEYCKELNKKAVNLLKDAQNHKLNKSVDIIVKLQKISQEVSTITSNMHISADQFIEKLQNTEIVPVELINTILENTQYLGFCKQIASSSRVVYFTNSWLSPWQNIDNKINSKGGYIDSLFGHLKSTIYKNLDEVMEQFSAVAADRFEVLSNIDENDIDKYINLKNYVEVFKEISKSVVNQALEIESLCDYLDKELIAKFNVETEVSSIAKQHFTILKLLGVDEINQYTNHLGLYLMQIDFGKLYDEKISDLSQSTGLRFKNHIEDFIQKFIAKFSNSTAKTIFESVNMLKTLSDKLIQEPNYTTDKIIEFLQDLPEAPEELEHAKLEFLKLKSLLDNNIQVRLPSNDGFIEQLVGFNEHVQNLYHNYSQRKTEEFNKGLDYLIQSFTLKVLKKYYDLSEKDKDSKLQLLKILEENLEVSSKGNLVNSIENIKDKLGDLIDFEEISQVEDIINESYYLADSTTVLNQQMWFKQITLLVSQIQNDVQKDLAVEEAKNHIKILLNVIEDSITTIVQKSSDTAVIDKRLNKLSKSLEEMINIIPGKTATEFVNIFNDKIDDQYLKIRKAVLKKHLKTISAAKNLVIDATILEDFNILSNKIDEAIDWYETLPKIYQKIMSPKYVLESKIKSFNTINEKNFTEFLKQVLEFGADFKYSASKANEINSVIEAASKSNLSIKLDSEQKFLSISGDCIKTSDIQAQITGNIKAIKVKSFCNILFDSDLVAKGASIVIVAPKWIINKEVVIDLSGHDALSHNSSKASDGHGYTNRSRNGQDGKDGLPGLPGENGGHFYGTGQEFVGLDKLLIDVRGGNGGSGQDGGNGSGGQDNNQHAGKPPSRHSHKEVVNKSGTIWKYWYLKNKGYDDCSFHYDKVELYHGFPGGKGGNGGKGGSGGYGGLKGTVKLYCGEQFQQIGTIASDGTRGTDGAAGIGGTGGKDSNNLEIFLGYAPAAPRIHEAKYGRKNETKYGQDGIRPKEKSDYNKVLTEDTKTWFELLVYQTQKEYILIQNNDDLDKFAIKIQKTYLKDFCERLSLSHEKTIPEFSTLQKYVEEIDYKAAEEKKGSFAEVLDANPVYSGRYSVLAGGQDTNDGWGWEESNSVGGNEW
jgi:energy-coupling factor transporter ATP-binding protein EcfA2